MRYIKTFESYLEGGRQPLYTWIKFPKIIETDELNVTNPSLDKNKRKRGNKDQIKSISLTRSSHYQWVRDVRLVLDQEKLMRDGYITKPFDELGLATINNDRFKSMSKHSYYKGLKTIKHGISDLKSDDNTMGWEEEYEERIYKDIKNIGKYIIYIDFFSNSRYFTDYKEKIVDYIKEYPHIKAREIKMIKTRSGSEIKSDRGDILLDIDMIRKKEKELVA